MISRVARFAAQGGVVVSMVVFAAGCNRQAETPKETGQSAAHDAHIVARSGLAMGSELTLMAWTARRPGQPGLRRGVCGVRPGSIS